MHKSHEREAMKKRYFNYLCAFALVNTLSACSGGGGGSTPSAGNAAATPTQTLTTLVVNSTGSDGNNYGLTVPNIPYGRGFRYAINGIDLEKLTTPTATQRSGQVIMNGYIGVRNVDGLGSQ